jgi:ABC-type dipeptide/oligopeptide/nickel transport system ATPase subunit
VGGDRIRAFETIATMTGSPTPAAPLVEFAGVSVVFDGKVRALDDVTLAVGKGEIVGLVGESGSGKSTLCRVLVGLTSPSSGTVKVGDRTVAEQLHEAPLAFRRRAQLLLQDAVASLSPRMTIGRTLEEPIAIHALPRADARVELDGILKRLGLSTDVLAKFPHQISGGQARRVGVARALLMRPEIIVADEPTAGLDVSVQASCSICSSTCSATSGSPISWSATISTSSAASPSARPSCTLDRSSRTRARTSCSQTPPTRIPRRSSPRTRWWTRRRESTRSCCRVRFRALSIPRRVPLPHALPCGTAEVHVGRAAASAAGRRQTRSLPLSVLARSPPTLNRTTPAMTPIDLTYLNGPDVAALALTDDEILTAVEGGLRAQGMGQTVLEPRVHLVPESSAKGHFNVLRGVVAPLASPASRWSATSSTTGSASCRRSSPC